MGKFALECPNCGSINTASNFVFAKKVITCGTCKEEIRVKQARLTSKQCPNCGKIFVYDQAKTKNRQCPSCGKEIDVAFAATASYKMARINCPQCACSIEVDKNIKQAVCPICDYKIENVEKEISKSNLVSDTGISVIQYEGDNNTLVWKHPIEDFNLGSQLVVHESQEAIFFLNGEALDSFGPGRHTLETENLPVLKKIYSLPTGSQTPFHAEVYFVNKTVQMGIKWGTDSRVRFIDPQTGIPLDIGAAGEMAVRVSDARKLLFKLVGTTNGMQNTELFGEDSNPIKKIFRAPIVAIVKNYLANIIKEQNINILEIDSHLGDISSALHILVKTKLEEYGLTVPEFYVIDVSLPEDDNNFKNIKALISRAYLGVRKEQVDADIAEAARQRELIEEQTKAQRELIKAQTEANALELKGMAEARVMGAKGYSQKDVLEADVKKAFAEGLGNMGSGSGGGGSSVASDLIGLMAGMKVAGGVLGDMDAMIQPPSASAQTPVAPTVAPVSNNYWVCSCGCNTNKGKFCEECGSPRVVAWDCSCGQKGNTGKCCPECGSRKPE